MTGRALPCHVKCLKGRALCPLIVICDIMATVINRVGLAHTVASWGGDIYRTLGLYDTSRHVSVW